MAWMEITKTQFWKILNEEMNESEDEQFAEKIMKFALKAGKTWGSYSIDYKVLIQMRNWCDKAIKEYEED